MNIKNIKLYVLLKNGKIKNSYFNMHSKSHRQLRDFEFCDGSIYLNYIEYHEYGAVNYREKVIATADTVERLQAYKKSTEVKK